MWTSQQQTKNKGQLTDRHSQTALTFQPVFSAGPMRTKSVVSFEFRSKLRSCELVLLSRLSPHAGRKLSRLTARRGPSFTNRDTTGFFNTTRTRPTLALGRKSGETCGIPPNSGSRELWKFFVRSIFKSSKTPGDFVEARNQLINTAVRSFRETRR